MIVSFAMSGCLMELLLPSAEGSRPRSITVVGKPSKLDLLSGVLWLKQLVRDAGVIWRPGWNRLGRIDKSMTSFDCHGAARRSCSFLQTFLFSLYCASSLNRELFILSDDVIFLLHSLLFYDRSYLMSLLVSPSNGRCCSRGGVHGLPLRI